MRTSSVDKDPAENSYVSVNVTTCGERFAEFKAVFPAEGANEGFGEGLVGTFTPLFQTSFFPDLMQVYLIPLTVDVEFSFGQESPALTAALAIFTFRESNRIAEQRTARNEFLLLIGKY